MAILIITSKADFSVDFVIKNLEEKDQIVYRLNTEDLCTIHSFELFFDDGGFSGLVNSHLREVKFSEIKSVYYRKPSLPTLHLQDPVTTKFIKEEIDFFLKWLWFLLGDKFWISNYSSIQSASSKLDQLRVAPKLGFCIPKTLVTNKPEVAITFFDECGGRVVNKVLHSVILEHGEQNSNIFCHSICRKDLLIRDSIKVIPCVFQEKIDKDVELRITVVGNRVFPCEIHSQKSLKTAEDWRNYDFENVPHLKHNLPEIIADQCRALLKYYHLAYGAIDMILTPEGKYVFLEINPNGQYHWIEKLTGLPITGAIADLLITGGIV